ncbi:MAG: hypothetical protein ACLU3F_15265 [Blautia wexlerae]
MSALKGACIIGQSGGPTSVINASCSTVPSAPALDSPSASPAYSAWHHGIKGVLNDDLFDMDKEDRDELAASALHTRPLHWAPAATRSPIRM